MVGIDPTTAPVVGVVLQKSHINTKDDAHYVSLIMELEAQGALVLPTYTGALDFSVCVDDYFFENGKSLVDVTINLTSFALWALPARTRKRSPRSSASTAPTSAPSRDVPDL